MATNNKQQVNIGAWDAMMAKVAGMPEIEQLVAEVDRLRAREQALAAEIAAMRPMVEALSCLNEAGSRIEPAAVYYALEVEPLIEEAQQFVAAHPAAGEAESEGE